MASTSTQQPDRRVCFCCLCPYCRTGVGVKSAWVLPEKHPLKTYWWAAQYCPTCGSRWSCWHWLEQRTGMCWRRVSAINPGVLTQQQQMTLLMLKRLYEHHPDEVR